MSEDFILRTKIRRVFRNVIFQKTEIEEFNIAAFIKKRKLNKENNSIKLIESSEFSNLQIVCFVFFSFILSSIGP